MFWIAFATLVTEITLTRLLSVITWYHMAFFAVSIAMLGMTAGAVRVYLAFRGNSAEEVQIAGARACLGFAAVLPLSLVLLCLVPFQLKANTMYLLGILVSSLACTLPFYFAGMAVSLLLTRHRLPVGKLYASDLAGASLGCLFVLWAFDRFDAPSLLFVAAGFGCLAAWCLASGTNRPALRRLALGGCALLAAASLLNRSPHGIRPLFVKKGLETTREYLFEKWNSFSRVVVYNGSVGEPWLWGPSPKMPQGRQVFQYLMNIDGEAATFLWPFAKNEDIEHLRYDITSLVYNLRPAAKTCVIGVGGGKDIQTALLFGSQDVLGVELNPVFVDLLQTRFRDVAGIAGNPRVRLVVDEARSYLQRTDEQFTVLQMSLIDTWAATGAGAFSLSENALYTVEAWKAFLNRLSPDGIFTVSRWHSERGLGETGRIVSLAMAALFETGAGEPRAHIILITARNVSTLLIRRTPFDEADLRQARAVCEELRFTPVILPGEPPQDEFLAKIVGADSRQALLRTTSGLDLNYVPPTDDSPYFFNMLRPGMLEFGTLMRFQETHRGVVAGNLTATVTLIVLILILSALAVATILVPLWLYARQAPASPTPGGAKWAGGLYFSLIGLGFMLAEIGLVQRLSVYLGHPIYALGIVLFTIIASTGLGSYLSEIVPATRRAWLLTLPVIAAGLILFTNLALGQMMGHTITMATSIRICLSVLAITPLGLALGMFFPTGMRLFRKSAETHLPWFWALNGVFGVVSSALAVFISIFFGIPTTFRIAACCYAAILPVCLLHTRPARAESVNIRNEIADLPKEADRKTAGRT